MEPSSHLTCQTSVLFFITTICMVLLTSSQPYAKQSNLLLSCKSRIIRFTELLKARLCARSRQKAMPSRIFCNDWMISRAQFNLYENLRAILTVPVRLQLGGTDSMYMGSAYSSMS